MQIQTNRHLVTLATLTLMLAGGCAANSPSQSSDGAIADSRTLDTSTTDGATADQGPLPEYWPLSGDQPKSAELAPLAQAIGSAEVVGLGEATHGSGGLHRLRAAAVRHLIETMNFRLLAFEATWAGAEIADNYAMAGSCNDTGAQTAVEALSHNAWLSADIRKLLQWICVFNQNHKSDPVRVFGLDIQRPHLHYKAISEFVEATDWTDKSQLLAGLDKCFGVNFSSAYQVYTSSYAKENVAPCYLGMAALNKRIDDNATTLSASLGDQAVLRVKIALRALDGMQQFVDPQVSETLERRDQAMAELFVLGRQRYAASARAIIWASNSHLARRHELVLRSLDGRAYAAAGQRSLGGFLAQALADKYVAIAATAGQLGVTHGLRHWTLALDQEPKNFAASLGSIGPAALVNLRHISPTLWPVGQELGMVFYGHPRYMVPADQFDALLYLKTSDPMHNAFANGLGGPYIATIAPFKVTTGQRAETKAVPGDIPILQISSATKANGDSYTWLFRFAQGYVPALNTPLPIDRADRFAVLVNYQAAGQSTVQQFVALSGSLTLENWQYPAKVALRAKNVSFAVVADSRAIIDGPRIHLDEILAEISF
ncbi:MAG: erythromycin esterase family protein [Deltaproteobacteria bacterium]|nr:erythromycin esterase family protein [Deltaproteobacteria bacterium]